MATDWKVAAVVQIKALSVDVAKLATRLRSDVVMPSAEFGRINKVLLNLSTTKKNLDSLAASLNGEPAPTPTQQ